MNATSRRTKTFAAAAVAAAVLGGAAAQAQAAKDLYAADGSGNIYKMNTGAMTTAPQLLHETDLTVQFQGLAAGCDALYVNTGTKIYRVASDGTKTEIASNLGTGTAYSLAISPDGTRLWWTTENEKAYTRLVADPVAAAPTEIVSSGLTTLPLLTRVGNSLAVRGANTSADPAFVMPATADPTTPVEVTAPGGGDRTYIGSNETRAFYEWSANLSSGGPYTIGSLDPSAPATPDTNFATLPSAFTPGVIAADADKVIVFYGVSTGVQDVVQIDIAAAAPRAGVKVTTMPAFVQAAATPADVCYPAATPTPAPAPAPTPAVAPAAPKIGAVKRVGPFVSTKLTSPGAGTLRMVAGRSKGWKVAAFRPRTITTAAAGTQTVRSVLTPATRALLRTRDVRVKVTVTYTTASGATSRSTRIVTLKRTLVRLAVTG